MIRGERLCWYVRRRIPAQKKPCVESGSRFFAEFRSRSVAAAGDSLSLASPRESKQREGDPQSGQNGLREDSGSDSGVRISLQRCYYFHSYSRTHYVGWSPKSLEKSTYSLVFELSGVHRLEKPAVADRRQRVRHHNDSNATGFRIVMLVGRLKPGCAFSATLTKPSAAKVLWFSSSSMRVSSSR
jgi:hypothetical protein